MIAGFGSSSFGSGSSSINSSFSSNSDRYRNARFVRVFLNQLVDVYANRSTAVQMLFSFVIVIRRRLVEFLPVGVLRGEESVPLMSQTPSLPS